MAEGYVIFATKGAADTWRDALHTAEVPAGGWIGNNAKTGAAEPNRQRTTAIVGNVYEHPNLGSGDLRHTIFIREGTPPRGVPTGTTGGLTFLTQAQIETQGWFPAE